MPNIKKVPELDKHLQKFVKDVNVKVKVPKKSMQY
jgi:hypothetical protein